METPCPTRSPYQRDRDRIVHSAAFRRLEYKTQVFVNYEGDHYRTRLTHSLEVAQLAASMCRALHLNEDLGEALALAHDLGHPPFGHAGEYGIQDVMAPYGGFDHNAQAIRIVGQLEQRYAAFDGLNLTWETLEGIAKHNGALVGQGLPELPYAMASYQQQHDLELHTLASAEAQVAALADDIAYNNHDLEDGIRAGFFTLDDLDGIAFVKEHIRDVDNTWPALHPQRRVHEVIRRLIHAMVQDVLKVSQAQLEASGANCVKDIRHLDKPVIAFSPDMQAVNLEVKAFLKERMYRHYRVNRMSSKAKRVTCELFTFFFEHSDCLPPHWREHAELVEDATKRARIICDYIAGMTDRFALQEHQRLFNVWERT